MWFWSDAPKGQVVNKFTLGNSLAEIFSASGSTYFIQEIVLKPFNFVDRDRLSLAKIF